MHPQAMELYTVQNFGHQAVAPLDSSSHSKYPILEPNSIRDLPNLSRRVLMHCGLELSPLKQKLGSRYGPLNSKVRLISPFIMTLLPMMCDFILSLFAWQGFLFQETGGNVHTLNDTCDLLLILG
jgi:hypothetical protein